MSLRKRRAVSATIPTATMADIAFLLIIFFLVTTSFSQDKGLEVTLPRNGESSMVPARNITRVVIGPAGEILHDSDMVSLEALSGLIRDRTARNPLLIVSIRTDPDARYESFVDVVDAVKQAGNDKISIAAPDW